MMSEEQVDYSEERVRQVFEDYKELMVALTKRFENYVLIPETDGNFMYGSYDPDMIVGIRVAGSELIMTLMFILEREMSSDELQYMSDILDKEGSCFLPGKSSNSIGFIQKLTLGSSVDGSTLLNHAEKMGRDIIDYLSKRGYRAKSCTKKTEPISRDRYYFAYSYVKDTLSKQNGMVTDVKDEDDSISFSVPGTTMTGRFFITKSSSCAEFVIPVNRVTEIEPVDEVLYKALGHLDIFDIWESDFPSDSVKIHVNISVQDSVQDDRKRLPQELERAVVKCREYHDMLRKAGF